MKKRWIVVFVLALTFIVAVAVAQEPAVKRYWQDQLRKPNQAWIEAYGYREDSVLAYNVRSMLEVQELLVKKVMALEATLTDPNEVE